MKIEFELRKIPADTSDLPLTYFELPKPPGLLGTFHYFISTDDKALKSFAGEFLAIPVQVAGGDQRQHRKIAPTGFFILTNDEAQEFQTLPPETQQAVQAKHLAAQTSHSSFVKALLGHIKKLDLLGIDRSKPEFAKLAEYELHFDGYKPVTEQLNREQKVRDQVNAERAELALLDLPPAQKALQAALLNLKEEFLISSPDDKDVKQWVESASDGLKQFFISKIEDSEAIKKAKQAQAKAEKAKKHVAHRQAAAAQAEADKALALAESQRIAAENAKREAERLRHAIK